MLQAWGPCIAQQRCGGFTLCENVRAFTTVAGGWMREWMDDKKALPPLIHQQGMDEAENHGSAVMSHEEYGFQIPHPIIPACGSK